MGEDAEALAERGARAPAACSSAATPARRSGTTWRARTTCCPRVAPRASRAPSARRTFRRRMARVSLPAGAAARLAPGGRRARARRGLPGARRVDGATRVSRTADISRQHGRDRRPPVAVAGRHGPGRSAPPGVGFFDHLLDAVARHGGLDLDVQVQGDLQTGPHHTVEDTGHRARAGARPGAR